VSAPVPTAPEAVSVAQETEVVADRLPAATSPAHETDANVPAPEDVYACETRECPASDQGSARNRTSCCQAKGLSVDNSTSSEGSCGRSP
jgi:hypothetical protein